MSARSGFPSGYNRQPTDLNMKLKKTDQLITHLLDTLSSLENKLIMWQSHLKEGSSHFLHVENSLRKGGKRQCYNFSEDIEVCQ